MKLNTKLSLIFRFTITILAFVFPSKVEAVELNVQPEVKVYTLADVLDLAKKNSPELMLSAAQEERQEGKLKAARSNFYPNIVLDGETTVGRYREGNFEESDAERNIRLALLVDQKIYTGGRNKATYKKAKALQEAARLRNKVVTNHLFFKIKESFYRYLTTSRKIEITEEHFLELEKELKKEKARFLAGSSPKVYSLRLEQALATTRSQLRSLDLEKGSQRQLVFKLAGIPAEANISELEDALPQVKVENQLSDLVLAARESRPEYGRFEELITAAEHEIDAQRSKAKPDVSLFASYGLNHEYRDEGSNDYNPEWQVGISGKWVLFDSGETRGLVKAARAEKRVRELQRIEFENELTKEVSLAYQKQVEAREQHENSSGLARIAQSALVQIKARYQIGKASQLDILEAQTKLMEARLVELDSDHKAAIASALLEKAVAANLENHCSEIYQ